MSDPTSLTTAAPGAALSGAAPTGAPSTSAQSPEQLRALAAQFEALLLTQLLNTMRSSMLGDDDAEEGGGFAKGPLADALYSELSLAISRTGGVGLGESIMSPLLRQTGVPAGTFEGGAGRGADFGLASATGETAIEPGRATSVTSLLAARVTSGYGWRQDPIEGGLRLHKGTDLAMPVGQEVPVARDGKVAFAGELPGYGRTVLVTHDGNRSTRYAHLSELTVKTGDSVVSGQVIGLSGASGRATGPHLHFELLEDGQPVDPAGRLGLIGSAIQISD
jgi:murein DD-endopeptidase MepM/ murein hydrolase activator NlpD